VPVHNYFLAPAARPLAARSAVVLRRAHLRTTTVVAITEESADAYRTLGLSDDATYDQIMDTYMELTETYAEDTARLGALEKAKEVVLDDRLRQRMSGTLTGQYEGMRSIEDAPKPPAWWETLPGDLKRASGRVITKPSPKYALRVFSLLGGLSFATWIAPSTAGTILLINVMSGMGFVYNRGQADVARDDFGQVGEIRPLQPKPFALTFAIVFSIWVAGYFKTKSIIAGIANPPRTLEGVLRTTVISCGLIIPALFVRVHDVFD